MAILKNTTINDTGFLQIAQGPTVDRPLTNTIVQSFASVGTTTWTAPANISFVEILVVAGGGGGASSLYNGGGGAGGLIYRSNYTVTAGSSYSITVGGGGAVNTNGSNSVFDTLTATGGGRAVNGAAGATGGSGGGGAYSGNATAGFAGGAGTPYQGYPGGQGGFTPGFGWGGGGGGAGGPGARAIADGSNKSPGSGGNGLQFSISGSSSFYAGGGGGHIDNNGFIAIGGLGGGGRGSDNTAAGAANSNGVAGTANTGGGGGWNAAGGSGVVILRYTRNGNNDPTGLCYYNTDLSDIEVYENSIIGWSAQDPTKNFAGHNLYPQRVNLSANWTDIPYATIVSTTETTAPDGTLTAYKFTETAVNNQHFAYLNTSRTAGRIYCQSIYVKPINTRYIALAHASRVVFDLDTLAIDSSADAGFTNAGIRDAGNGWYRIWHATIANTTTNYVFIYPNNWAGEAVPVYAGNVSNGFYIWGHQMEENVITPGPWTPTNGSVSPPPETLGGYNRHIYINVGESSFSPACSGKIEVLVIGGGGGGGANHAGGGGAGGLIYSSTYNVLADKKYKVVVGAGGQNATVSTGTPGALGGDSVFASLIAAGGGGGGNRNDATNTSPGRSGGSGGGGGGAQEAFPLCYEPGASISGQGNPGGRAVNQLGGGGGGAGAPGRPGVRGGAGGNGLPYAISGALQYYAGGGGGGYSGGGTGVQNGGLGGGGIGGYLSGDPGTVGTPNTGGGGGGGGAGGQPGSSGGSGIVIITYRSNS